MHYNWSHFNWEKFIDNAATVLWSMNICFLKKQLWRKKFVLQPWKWAIRFLPTAYVVRGKVMFWHVSVLQWFCLSTPGGGGYPGQVPGWGGGQLMGDYPNWGVPHLRYPHLLDLARGPPMGGGYPTSVPPSDLAWGYPNMGVPTLGTHPPTPPSDLAGATLTRGTPPRLPPPPRQTWGGGTTSSSTWYAAVGMPLAFPQEDFLVLKMFLTKLFIIKRIIQTSNLLWKKVCCHWARHM